MWIYPPYLFVPPYIVHTLAHKSQPPRGSSITTLSYILLGIVGIACLSYTLPLQLK